jgi:hypothetical protein
MAVAWPITISHWQRESDRRFLRDGHWIAQALERTGLNLWVSPWGFWFARISSPVAQLSRLPDKLRRQTLRISRRFIRNRAMFRRPIRPGSQATVRGVVAPTHGS